MTAGPIPQPFDTPTTPGARPKKTLLFVALGVLVVLVIAGALFTKMGGRSSLTKINSIQDVRDAFTKAGLECEDWTDKASTTQYMGEAPEEQWTCEVDDDDMIITIYRTKSLLDDDLSYMCSVPGSSWVRGENWSVMGYSDGFISYFGVSDFPADRVIDALGGKAEHC